MQPQGSPSDSDLADSRNFRTVTAERKKWARVLVAGLWIDRYIDYLGGSVKVFTVTGLSHIVRAGSSKNFTWGPSRIVQEIDKMTGLVGSQRRHALLASNMLAVCLFASLWSLVSAKNGGKSPVRSIKTHPLLGAIGKQHRENESVYASTLNRLRGGADQAAAAPALSKVPIFSCTLFVFSDCLRIRVMPCMRRRPWLLVTFRGSHAMILHLCSCIISLLSFLFCCDAYP